jgi:hypothetical protein
MAIRTQARQEGVTVEHAPAADNAIAGSRRDEMNGG